MYANDVTLCAKEGSIRYQMSAFHSALHAILDISKGTRFQTSTEKTSFTVLASRKAYGQGFAKKFLLTYDGVPLQGVEDVRALGIIINHI